MRVCFFGTYEADYDRNRILLAGLRQNGVDVIECHSDLWGKAVHKTGKLTRPGPALRFAVSLMVAYVRLAYRYMRTPPHDIVLVGYLGHLDVFVARALTLFSRRPVVLDAFISLYDTLVVDRKMFRSGSAAAGLLRRIDRWSCLAATHVLVDTQSHIDGFVELFGLHRSRFTAVLVGADPEVFYEPPHDQRIGPAPFRVLHYSKFSPLHGLPFILQAAKELQDEPDVEFVLVGGGQLREQVDAWIRELNLTNLVRLDWMTPDELRVAIANAGACLGVFGDTPKAGRVIPNKVYQALACGGALITRDGPGPRELLVDGKHALLCAPADPKAIAACVRRLKDDSNLRVSLKKEAASLFLRSCTPRTVTAPLVELLQRLLAK